MTAALTRRDGFPLASRTLLATVIGLALFSTQPVSAQTASTDSMFAAGLPDYDANAKQARSGVRVATAAQLQALAALQTATGAQDMTARWNDFGGSPDVIYDFVSPAYAGTPEQAARAFIGQNAALFGLADAGTASLRLVSAKDALGGHMVRFQQIYNGVMVEGGGIGIVLNGQNQVVMASGPFFRGVSVNTTPTLSATQAVAAAAAELGKYHVPLPVDLTNLQELGLAVLDQQVLPEVAKLPPALWIYPTATGYKLAWKVAQYSTNPFGLYEVAVDAHTGEVLARKNHVSALDLVGLPLPGQETADIFPTSPLIDDNLKNNSVISTCTTNGRSHPCGQERVTLRAFDATNRVTGVNGTLTGTNVIVNNALASKLPFGQAALGTWHFSKDDPAALEARTNEADQLAEPAEHQDDINAFFFVNYNKEYIDYLHVAGDAGSLGGGGAFPDNYQNKGVPSTATVHIPNYAPALQIALNCDTSDAMALVECAKKYIKEPTDPDFVKWALGLDNAMAVQSSALIASLTGAQPEVAVNPTVYGHGYYFNDLAIDGMVAYHETMHSTSTPIAGLEGFEGGSLNEGQADMWAYTLADHTAIGEYVVQAKGFRDRLRGRGDNPDSLGWIRSARSTLKYGDFLRKGDGEVHWGGEIFAAAMWDVREMLNRQYPGATTHKRPDFRDGKPTRAVTAGTEIFERDYLGTMYILGTMNPDTFVKARDAFIVADQLLYPSSSDPGARGKHRALVEQVFAAHELGVNAQPSGGAGSSVTLSTQVTPFAGNQPAPPVPTYVSWAPASATSMKVSWVGVPGAIAYEVLKRKTALAGKREVDGPFVDGDASTTGFRHVAYVAGNRTSFEDKGKLETLWLPAGLTSLTDSEYVVRAIGANASGQLGWSALSKGRKGSQPSDGTSAPPAPVYYFTETYTGSLPGAWADGVPIPGVSYQDYPLTTKADVLRLEVTLDSSTDLSQALELRSTDGQVLAEAQTYSASAVLSAVVAPNTTYVVRVKAVVNPVLNYIVKIRQVLPAGSPNANEVEQPTVLD